MILIVLDNIESVIFIRIYVSKVNFIQFYTNFYTYICVSSTYFFNKNKILNINKNES